MVTFDKKILENAKRLRYAGDWYANRAKKERGWVKKALLRKAERYYNLSLEEYMRCIDSIEEP